MINIALATIFATVNPTLDHEAIRYLIIGLLTPWIARYIYFLLRNHDAFR